MKILPHPIRWQTLGSLLVTASSSDAIEKQPIHSWMLNDWIEAREELWGLRGTADKPVKIVATYNVHGDYIGDLDTAKWMIGQGIKPEVIDSTHSVCSVGWCERQQAWAGWSHRALCVFKIGDKLFEQDYGDDQTPYVDHGRVTITSHEQARQAAVNFADYVS